MTEVVNVDISALFGPPGADRDACDAAIWQGLFPRTSGEASYDSRND